MHYIPQMFTHSVCFKTIIHAATSNIDHHEEIKSFLRDLDQGGVDDFIDAFPFADILLDQNKVDRDDSVDVTDFLRRHSNEYPLLIKISAAKPQIDINTNVINFSQEKAIRWILAKDFEHASKMAIEFAIRLEREALDAKK